VNKSLAIIAGLALTTTLSLGQKRLVPTAPGESILIRGPWLGIKLSHNGCDTIAKEVLEQEVRQLLIRILKVPEDTALKYLVGGHCDVQVSTFGLKKEDAESLVDVLSDYVGSRASGHTTRYALDSLNQRLMQPKAETNGFRATLFETFPYLPRDWVKEDPFQSATVSLSNSTLSPKRFVVIDGEIAWTYSVPIGGWRAWESKVDAQEFDPKLRPKFDAARKEAEQNLERRGIKKRLGYVHLFEAEVDSVLWQKYQIKRRGFRELNPGITAD
jgi:hypothetical protein